MKPMKSYTMQLSRFAIKMISTSPATRLYQKKIDGPNTVRFFTDRADSLVRDLSRALGGTQEEIQKKLGILTREEKAALALEESLKEKKRMVKRQMNQMLREAKANGVDVRNIL